MESVKKNKILVQCDFDGTITYKDVSFMLLDHFADSDWRKLLAEYQAGRLSVGVFNTRAFALIRAREKTMLDFVARSEEVRVRPGFKELLDYCAEKGLEFVIVSNGADFYIDAILKNLGVANIKVYAAQSRFHPGSVEVRYITPDGSVVQDRFKEKHTDLFLSQGYRVIYIGNGVSDFSPAQRAEYVFATGELLKRCRELNLGCIPFDDLHEVIRGLRRLKLD